MKNTRGGFTLVELLVAMGLFSLAISIAVGGFVSALRTQRQVVGLLAANSNASLAIEQIAREMRTGIGFTCLGVSPCTELSFKNAQGADVTYRLRDGGIERGIGPDFERMTAENVEVRELSFTLLGFPDYPPRITIAVAIGTPIRGIEESVTNLQTTVSSRRF